MVASAAPSRHAPRSMFQRLAVAETAGDLVLTRLQGSVVAALIVVPKAASAAV